MDWSKIISIALPLILDCIKDRGRDEAKASLRDLRPRQVLRLRGELRRQGLNRQRIDDEVDRIKAELRDANDEELDALLDEAEAA